MANNASPDGRKQILVCSMDCGDPPPSVDLNLSTYSDSCQDWANYWTQLLLYAAAVVWVAAAAAAFDGERRRRRCRPIDERTSG